MQDHRSDKNTNTYINPAGRSLRWQRYTYFKSIQAF